MLTRRVAQQHLRILYMAGPGDVVSTYRHWVAGRDDPTEVAVTYSGQFYEICRRMQADAFVVSSCSRADSVSNGRLFVRQGPVMLARRGGALYHLGQFLRALRVTANAVWIGADVVVIAEGMHWFLLAPIRWLGIRVIPSLHCALWPAGFRPAGAIQRGRQWLNGWFWRRVADATICVSPECERQVREIARKPSGPIYQSRANYRRAYFESITPPDIGRRRRLGVLYAGRIETKKGVYDLLEVAVRLARDCPGRFAWELCGAGPELESLRAEAARLGLRDTFRLLGKLDRIEMARAYARCHVVVVPTNSAFAEGLNKVAVEGVLAGRPVVTSRLSNAADVLGDALVEVRPDDVEGYCCALRQLADDDHLYRRKCDACHIVNEQFFDDSRSWGAALRRALGSAGVLAKAKEPDGHHVAFS